MTLSDHKITYGDPKVTYSDPNITYCDPKVTYCDHNITYCDPKVTPPYCTLAMEQEPPPYWSLHSAHKENLVQNTHHNLTIYE